MQHPELSETVTKLSSTQKNVGELSLAGSERIWLPSIRTEDSLRGRRRRGREGKKTAPRGLY